MKLDHRIGRLRFRDLDLLVALAAGGSLRQVAQGMGASQPALSKSLRDIEQAFGATLFTRSRTGLSPTAAGLRIIADAEILLAEIRQARQAVATAREHPLRIGCTPVLALVVLPILLAGMADMQSVVIEGAVPELIDALSRGRVDAILVNYPDADHEGDDFVHTLLFKEQLVVVAHRDMAVGDTWKSLSACPWVLPPRQSVIRRAIDHRFLAEGLRPPVPKIESVYVATNLRFIESGLAVGAIPHSVLSIYEGHGEIRIVNVRPKPEIPPISLVYRKSMDRHPRLKILKQALESAVRPLRNPASMPRRKKRHSPWRRLRPRA